MYDAGLTSWAGLDGACGGGWVGRRTPPAAAACQRPARGPRGRVSAGRPRASTWTCRRRQIPDPAGARRVEMETAADGLRWVRWVGGGRSGEQPNGGLEYWELGLHRYNQLYICWVNGLGLKIIWAKIYVWCGCGFICGCNSKPTPAPAYWGAGAGAGAGVPAG